MALPALLAIFFASQAATVLGGAAVRFQAAWVPQLGLEIAFSLDSLSLLFALLICGVGALVILYADRYLAKSPERGRFHAIVLAFMASMLGLVLADNLLLLVVFWGLTGVTSYLLIGFDHDNGVSRLSAQQALLVTVTGELAMLAGIILLGFVADTFTISALPMQANVLQQDARYGLITVLIVIGALSKSAQFPFHFWLPNAMAAPTPVSAYLHSATMVTAGVYLLSRLTPTLGGTQLWAVLLVTAGGVTMLIGAFLSLRQHDLKRVLAYSTVGALGAMVMLVGIGTPAAAVAAMALLLAHALYKAGLFLVTGIIDHTTGTRELDRLSGLARRMPITAAAAALAILSMAGLPPMVGFAAKELGFKAGLDAPEFSFVLIAALVLAGAATVGAAAIVGIGPFGGREQQPPEGVHEASWSLWLAPLTLGSVGVLVGLLPWLGSARLVGAASELISGASPKSAIEPWYGVDLALLLSGVSIAVGAAIFIWRLRVREAITRTDLGHRLGPERVYVVAELWMLRFAKASTAILQNGLLRIYLLVVMATLVSLVWLVLLLSGGIPPIDLSTDAYLWEVITAALIAGGAAVAVTSGSRLGAVTALGLVGYGISLIFVFFSAPDLAMAQILVETLTVLLFVLAFYHLPRFGQFTARPTRLRDGIVALVGGSLVTLLVLIASAGPHDPISRFFMEMSQPAAKGHNVVNTIIVDFRALDTLGEIAVLGVAGFGVYSLLKLRARARKRA